MSKTQYRCLFMMDGKNGCLDTNVPDIAAVKDGFWVNNKFKFTTGSDCRYWLPPSSILYVIKEVKE